MTHSALIDTLPRREREVFELLCSLPAGTVAEVRSAMAAPPSYSAVRTLLGRLESKGLVQRRSDSHAHIYELVIGPAKVRESALKQIVGTLFAGSAVSAATALMNLPGEVDEEELEALQAAIEKVKGRRA